MAMKPIQVPHRAEKRRVKLKLGIEGPSGSGKTLSALALIKNLWPDAKVLCVDTENQSAELYSDHPLAPPFDELPLEPPFETVRYEACIDYAVKNGYEVLLMDSISHQWEGEGGILRRKDELDKRPNSNSYMNWNAFTPEHTHFLECIKQSPIHIVATMRSKQDYALDNSSGKVKPVKLGMAPIVREGTEYEFAIVFDIQMDHKCTLSKNRTGLFEGKVIDLADPAVAEELRAWLESGKAVDSAKDWSTESVKTAGVGAPVVTTNAVGKKEYPPPTITEYPVDMMQGRGRNKKMVTVMWYELVGYVIGIKHEKVANGQDHTFMGIHGLPETDKVLGERHRRFESYEDHLQAVPTAKYKEPIMRYVKPGSRVVFRFFPDLAGPKAKVPGALIQYIEELLQVDDHYFDSDGKEITQEQSIEIAAKEMQERQAATGEAEPVEETPSEEYAEASAANPFAEDSAAR